MFVELYNNITVNTDDISSVRLEFDEHKSYKQVVTIRYKSNLRYDSIEANNRHTAHDIYNLILDKLNTKGRNR